MRLGKYLGVLLVGAGWSGAMGGVEDAVVRIATTRKLPNPLAPWSRQKPMDVGGTGVVIEGKKILTNAHVVLYASDITVQARDGGDRYEAKVEAIAPGIDLALLTVEDPAFLEKRPTLPRAQKLPSAGLEVAVLGFPIGGRELSMTRGVVSRVEYTDYDERTSGLRIQVDAAVNPGNSGGPALLFGRMIGLTFGQLAEAENVGYIIPNEEIDDFVADAADGKVEGKPRFSGSLQALENEALRARLGLAKPVRGVMVRDPGGANGDSPLKEYDVLLRIGDQAIDNEGMIRTAEGRMPMMAEAARLARSGKVPATVLRDGKSLEVELPLDRADRRLLRSFDGQAMPFFVHGPLVFAPVFDGAISFYLRTNPILMYQDSPLTSRRHDHARFPGEELVIVTSPMFAHKMTKGYADPFGRVLAEVNGAKVKNFAHLVEILASCRDEFLSFRFAGADADVMVFRRAEMEAATDEIMAENGVSRRGSEDALAIWKRRDAAPAGPAPAPAPPGGDGP